MQQRRPKRQVHEANGTAGGLVGGILSPIERRTLQSQRTRRFAWIKDQTGNLGAQAPTRVSHIVEAIERRVLQSGMRLSPRLIRLRRKWAGALERPRKLNRWSKRLRRKTTGEPSAKHAVKLSAQCLALPTSPLDRQSVIVSALTVGNAANWSRLIAGVVKAW